jgi:putative PIN family toxin of toxin-antitoxin system
MRIMIDTNVLISAALFPNSQISLLINKVTVTHELILCSYIIDELHEIFHRKFKDRIYLLDKFLYKLAYELIYTPTDIKSAEYPEIRDKEDLPILVSALLSDVDILITGDKDFFDVDMDKPEILTPREYLEKY